MHIRSAETVLPDLLQAFGNLKAPLSKAMNISFGRHDMRKPLQEVMDMFLVQLGSDQTEHALFTQCDQTQRLGRSLLPPSGRISKQATHAYKAFGCLLAKCLLEGIHVPITFCSALHSILVGHELLSSSSDECIAMMAEFDIEEAQRLRQVLAAHHGDGSDLMLSAGSIMNTKDETLVSDANKDDVICRKVTDLCCCSLHMRAWS